MSVLKLNDFLDNEIYVSLNDKEYKLNTSFKAFCTFLKWCEEVKDLQGQDVIGKDLEFLKIVIQDKPNDFMEAFESLGGKNQKIILEQLIKYWQENTLPHFLNTEDPKKK